MNNFTRFAIHGALLAAFVAPYTIDGWWKFLVATVVIVGCERTLSGPKSYISNLGLKLSLRSVVLSFTFLGVFWALSRAIIFPIADAKGLVSQIEKYGYHIYLLTFFQALNEEMLLRAKLLNTLERKLKNPSAVNVIVSTVFVALHFVFYRFGHQQRPLDILVLATLLFFSLAMNAVYQHYRHIGYTAALHIGWNFSKLGETWAWIDSGRDLHEVDNFNFIEGSLTVFGLSVALFVVSVFIVRTRRQSTELAISQITKRE